MREAAASVLSEDDGLHHREGRSRTRRSSSPANMPASVCRRRGYGPKQTNAWWGLTGHTISVLARSPSSWRRRCGRPPCWPSFPRLLVDANRAEGHPDLFRPVADGELVMINQGLSPSERELRMRYHRPFHQAVDTALLDCRAPLLFSVHSFTPVYEGTIRNVELGSSYDDQEEHAFALGAALARELPNVAYNEPWSGKDGLIYSAETHSRRNHRVALEIEVRQDLAVDPTYRARLIRSWPSTSPRRSWCVERSVRASPRRASSSAKLQGR